METKQQPETLKAAVDALGLEYRAEFVPFSKSRNAKKATKPGDYSLNWRVTISKGARRLETDYMQGIGHIPWHQHKARYSIDEWEALKYACEQGKTPRLPYGSMPSFPSMGAKPIPAPALYEVLYCLSMDAGAIDYASFEEWAEDFGYDTDSRAGEKIYRECLRIALELRAMIGDAGLQSLRDAAQDY
jgi:hypothetical protein